jgi:PAS domain S-box-containing protein
MKKDTPSKISNPQSLRTLMVDDSENDVLLIIHNLQKGGYDPLYERVETAAAMKNALKVKQWDIILCDYKMPKFNAPSAIAVLKKANIDISLIIVSGTMGEETAVECMRLGAKDYIMKSNLSRLCPAIARELEELKVRNKEKQMESQRESVLKALHESEEKYRTILEDIQEGYFEDDLAGNFTFFNDTLCRIMGYPRKELMGMNNRQYMDKENSKKVFQAYNKVYTTGEPNKGLSWQIERKDGIKRYFEGSVSLLKDSSGKLIGFRGIAHDITERKRVEDALRKSEERYRELVKYASVGIYDVDYETGRLNNVNDVVYEFTEYTQDELLNMNFSDIFTEESQKSMGERLEKLYAGEKIPPTVEYCIRTKSGEKLWVQLNARYFYENGKLKRATGIIHNITERKQAEEALKKSEVKYRNIFENAMEGIYQSTMEGRFITVNNALARMAGYDSPEELIESIQDIGTQLYVHPENRKRFMEIREAKGFVDNFEAEFYKKNGSTFWVVINAISIKDAQGKMLYTEGLIEDITIRKKAEEQLHKSLESLKKAVGTTVQVLVSALEFRDPYTSGHQSRTANLACAIAMEMGLPNDKIDGIRMAGIIHDIGKLSIPVEILSKPTRLTELEFSLIKEHARSGYEMLKDVESSWPLAEIVYQHHERMNGTGYPRNLKGNEILMEARIMAVADVVEAMASHRPYRPTMGIEAALKEIKKNKGILYDDAVADACLRLFKEKGYGLE